MRTPLNKVRRIVFIGAECTGKSTIARAVAEHFGDPCSDEYVRQYVEQLDRSLDESDLEPIAQGQIRLEDDAYAKAARYVFHDTNLLSSILYAEHYFNTSIHWVDERFISRVYDRYFFCQPDIPWKADAGQRVGPQERERLHKQFESILERFRIPYITLEGSSEKRLNTVLETLT